MAFYNYITIYVMHRIINKEPKQRKKSYKRATEVKIKKKKDSTR